MGKLSRMGNALYEGRVSIDFVGRKWLWYSISGLIIVLAASGLFFKGLNFGIEFKGGVEYTVSVPASQLNQTSVDKIRTAVADTNLKQASSPIVNTSGDSIRVQTEQLSNADAITVTTAIAKAVGINADRDISAQDVGASWGSQVAQRALTGLIVFLILVVLFIWAYFREWKMSVAAIVALAHDIVITVGVYALSGFEVTPATVTGLLTILGFSLYDTVVVFDKVRENTRRAGRQSRKTYAELANLAINQTLVRSVNTSVVALLPVGALLYVGVATLGSGALKDLALALFVGMAAGAYSSIFIATPLAVQLKSREKAISVADARARARARRDVDRYASVPSFSEGLEVSEEDERAAFAEDDAERPVARVQAPPRRPEAAGSGRVVPQPKRPTTGTGSARRTQPSRQPRSKRGK